MLHLKALSELQWQVIVLLICYKKVFGIEILTYLRFHRSFLNQKQLPDTLTD